MARSNKNNATTEAFMESFENFGLKIGIHSYLNKYMNICGKTEVKVIL